MLTEIQKQNEELGASEQSLRQLAESISAVFWMTDTDKTRMIYVSPGYRENLGPQLCQLVCLRP